MTSVQSRVIGIWLIEDIKVSGDTSMFDVEQFRLAIEDQKQLRFELKQDSSITIYTGMSEISGLWYYEKKTNRVMVTLEGNLQPTPLGFYEESKLVNRDTLAIGAIITTIFLKEEPVEE